MIREWIELARDPSFAAASSSSKITTSPSPRSWCKASMSGSTRRAGPWEACGTSGMKVLVNGGLNFSERDGWWDEAYAPDLGWAIGEDESIRGRGPRCGEDAEASTRSSSGRSFPEFYDRDAEGMPRAWLARMRRSMAQFTPKFSSTRMARDYVEKYYLALRQAALPRAQIGATPARGEVHGLGSATIATPLAGSAPRRDQPPARTAGAGISRCRSISARSRRAMSGWSSTLIRAAAKGRCVPSSPRRSDHRRSQRLCLYRLGTPVPTGRGLHSPDRAASPRGPRTRRIAADTVAEVITRITSAMPGFWQVQVRLD